jgi:hypothetical protein
MSGGNRKPSNQNVLMTGSYDYGSGVDDYTGVSGAILGNHLGGTSQDEDFNQRSSNPNGGQVGANGTITNVLTGKVFCFKH